MARAKPVPVRLVKLTKDSPDYWVPRIFAALGKSVESILDVGRELTNAKTSLKKQGGFEQMVELEMPFSPSTARRLMIVAGDTRLLDRAHVHVLPPSWGTLYELTKLDDEEWREAKLAGLIRPDVERKEIAAFRRGPKEPTQPKPYADPGDAEVDLRNFLDRFIPRYPQDQLDRLALILRQIARDMLKTKN